jgi:mono/diheme cytochrome c family protein
MKTLCVTLGLLLVASAAKAQSAVGLTVYEKSCKMCHGADGTPSAPMLKMMPTLPTLNAKFMANRSEDSVVNVLTKGSANGKMKPFKGKLTPEEMAAVAKYVKEMAKVKTG